MPWLIEITNAEIRYQTLALQTKDGAYLTPHGRMGSVSKAAVMPTRKIALEVAEAWAPVLQRRMGSTTSLEPKHFTGQQDIDGAAVLLARARTQRWASNMSVDHAMVVAVRDELQAVVDSHPDSDQLIRSC